jgi:hypothetical protein
MESECIGCNKVVRTRQYINLPDKSWITHNIIVWVEFFSITHAILANKIGSILVK